MTVPVCVCHGLPSRWVKDRRYRAAGFWRCAETDRVAQRVRYHRDPAAKNLRDQRYWHQGGYVKRRRRELSAQRAHVLERLNQLEQEAFSLAQ